jgi:hypothetical protein
MDTVSYQRMLSDLRTTFNTRLPAGLTPKADARLRRTLSHWVREVQRVGGAADEQSILRHSYDSLVAWFRRNPDALAPGAPEIEAAVAPDSAAGMGLAAVGGPPFEGEVTDPLALFKARAETVGTASTPLTELETRPSLKLPPPMETRPAAPPVQPMDFLQRDEDIVKYREVEYNLLLNSKDRNWLQEVGQNRYNFTVILNAGGRARGTSAQPSIQNRFRNIVRLEFIKAILPVESLDLVLPKLCHDVSATPVASAFYSVLGMPFVTVVCDEHEGNNYGTADVIDKSLAVCQYDAMWRSDSFQTNDNTSRGYTLYFPKFMKAQRVYAPAPLATFQQLTFQIVNPENQLLSKTPDAYAIASFKIGSSITGTTCYDDIGVGNYIFVQTADYFPVWAFSQLDRITFGGQSGTTTAADSFVEWLQRDEGHVIVGTACGNTTSTISDGYNSDGYANYIIIQNRYNPPSSAGVVSVAYFAGSAANDATMMNAQINAAGKILNLSRQVQLALRVVCREKDPTTNLRPDNI